METVNSKKSYMVWLETLNADEARVVAGIEQRVRSEEVPKGLVGWRMFVVAVVAAYEVHTANAAFARVDAQRIADYCRDTPAGRVSPESMVFTPLCVNIHKGWGVSYVSAGKVVEILPAHGWNVCAAIAARDWS